MKNRFRSRLANELQDFLDFKRSLGIQYDSAEWMLRRFDRFVAQIFKGRRPIDVKVAIEGWLATFHCKPVTITNHFLVLPHIFSPAEIRILLGEIGKIRNPFRSRTYRALLLILYCTGLRTGEAVRLRIRDVDLREKVLRVEVSKAKSRWVPFEDSLAKELSDYLRARCLIRPATEDSRFLVQPNGSPLGRTIASSRITVLLRQAGMKPGRGRVGPRPYDTRHSFAVNRLTNWYREGVDVQERLAWLSAYLGHDDLLGTQDYLQLTPELRRIVSTRQEDYIRRCWDSEGR